MNCVHCGSGYTEKRGIRNGKTRRYCKNCSKWFFELGSPRILLFDIETSHIIFRGWNTGDQYVRHDQIIKDWSILCWSAKWLFDNKTMSDVCTPFEAKTGKDERVCKSIHKILSDAQVVITQNGDWFDLRKLNWKFIKYGFPPNNQYLSIDTLKKSRQIGKPSSHSLDAVSKELGLGEKSPMVEQDWIDAEAGDRSALAKMSKYCSHDVLLLEDWYLVLRPWMKTHPNLAAYLDRYHEIESDEGRCPRCLNVCHRSILTRRWFSAAGTPRRSGSCPHCGTILLIRNKI